MDGKPQTSRFNLWRDGGIHRVLMGATGGFVAGTAYATARSLPPAQTLRAGLACTVFAAPFFAFREVVAASMNVHGPVASAISGGFAGYFGALFVSGPHWKTISHSAMVMGVGCGFLDVLISGIDWKRKVFLVNRQDEKAAANNIPQSASWFTWPSWIPVVEEIDQEYEDLIRRQKATVLALEEEQARIAMLLRAIDSVKAGKQIRDAELAEAGLTPTQNGQLKPISIPYHKDAP